MFVYVVWVYLLRNKRTQEATQQKINSKKCGTDLIEEFQIDLSEVS